MQNESLPVRRRSDFNLLSRSKVGRLSFIASMKKPRTPVRIAVK